MNKYVAGLWIEELKSGENKQGKGCLESKDGMCCLGVLCLVADRNNVDVEMQAGTGFIVGTSLELQPEVKKWAGISHGLGHLSNMHCVGGATKTLLSDLNDKGKTFPEIADIIEQHWESL
jgi:hypothetical protein